MSGSRCLWYLGVPTMDAEPKWYRAHITDRLPGDLFHILLDTEDGRQVPVNGVQLRDLRTHPPAGARQAEYPA